MRKALSFLLLSVFLAFIFFYQSQFRLNLKVLLEGPCDRPITYHDGVIDRGYSISRKQFLDDILQAEKIWDGVVGKQLFSYDEKGEITVNLIYSNRQALSDNLNKLENNLEGGKQSLQQMEAQYKSLETDFNQKLAAFNAAVETFNKNRNATESQYNQLVSQQQQLKTMADQLNSLAAGLNLSVKDYNSQVQTYNQNVGTFNLAISERPEAGLYDGRVPKIDIYLTTSKNELIHTLAHEMGHALGLAHTANPQSIMYPYTNEVLIPNGEESQALQTYCQQKNYDLALKRIEGNLEKLVGTINKPVQ